MMESLIIALGGIVIVSFICQWLAWSIRLPAILFLLICGILIGPVFGVFRPDHIFENLLTPVVELSVSIILFEGSLSLNFKNIRGHLHVVGNLLSVGLLITCAASTFLAHWLFHLPYNVAILFAVIICVSGPTVVGPILRAVKPRANVSNILHWEGIIIDPIGVLLAVLVFNFVTVYSLHDSLWESSLLFITRILIAACVGLGVGYLCSFVLKRHLIPDFLKNVGVLAFVLLTFALGNYFQDGSGLLSVTLMGILLTNIKDLHIEDILDFKESLSILLISGTFLILAARISFQHLDFFWLPALIFVACLQFIVRPLSVFCSTLRAKLNLREKLFLAWIHPRGIVAAAVSAVFAIRLQQQNIPGYNTLVLMTFLVIIGTVVFQSLTAKPLAKLLKLSADGIQGLLIVGANPFARQIAKVLQEQNFNVLLCSQTWDNAQEARMENIPVFYGSPVSSYADRHLNLFGLDAMLAITPRTNLNSLSAMRFKREFGADNIFTIRTSEAENEQADKKTANQRIKLNSLFADDITYNKINRFIKQGWQVKSTRLGDEFSYADFLETHKGCIPLFTITPKKQIYFFDNQNKFKIEKDWHVVTLINNNEKISLN